MRRPVKRKRLTPGLPGQVKLPCMRPENRPRTLNRTRLVRLSVNLTSAPGPVALALWPRANALKAFGEIIKLLVLGRTKVAETVWSESSRMLQLPVFVHGGPHPANAQPGFGLAVSATTVPTE